MPCRKKINEGLGGRTHPGKRWPPLETHEKAGGRLLTPSGQMTADSIGLYLRRSQCSLQMQYDARLPVEVKL